ncbi:MAG: molybdate ABC transporter substrate-binding protein [Vicinamibacterales bacterium]
MAVLAYGHEAVAQGRTPRIAAASSLNFALKEISDSYSRQTGQRVDVVYGASGALARQILEGAPFDAFLAADEEFPARLAAAGVTTDGGVVYATGRLVVFAPSGSPLRVDPALDGLRTLLASRGVSRFAIANPAVAPYGHAAEAVLRKRGLWDGLRSVMVLGDTIAQAAQFATSGNAVGGLIAYSLVKSPELAQRGRYALIPAEDHPPLRQRMVLLKRAVAGTDAFYRYLQSADARAALRRYGFETP